MKIAIADSSLRDAWDAFVASRISGSFLQSWQWGEFQRAAGFPATRVAAYDDNNAMVAASLFVVRPLPLRRYYLYAPYGPVIGNVRRENVPDMLKSIRSAAVAHGPLPPVFIRVEPKESPDEAGYVLHTAGFTMQEYGVQPLHTHILDLSHSEEELLASCKQKTRYNIRLALRRGVTVREDTSIRGMDTFLRLAAQVQQSKHFRYHPTKYYHTMTRVLGGNAGMLSVLIAEHGGEALAAGCFMRYGDTMTYAHGATARTRTDLMAPYALHWHAIRAAKRAGLRWYDLFGVAPPASPGHSLAGISRFKRGFGGTERSYVGVADAVVERGWYGLFRTVRALRDLVH